MKTWLLLSLLLPLFSASYTLLTKSALSNIEPASFSSYSLLIASVLVIAYNIVKGHDIKITPYSAIGGLAFGLAIMGLTTGINSAPNPGLASAIYRTQTVLTAVLSVVLFGYHLNIEGAIGMMITLFGAYLIATDHKDAAKTDEPGAVLEKEKHKLDNSEWFIYPALAGVALTVKDLTGMESLKTGMSPSVFAVSQLVFATIVAFTHKYISTGDVSIKYIGKPNRSSLVELAGAAIINSVWVAVAIAAMTMAPNPGYSKAITMFGVIISTIASRFMFGDKIDSRSYGGIAAIVVGIMLLVVQKKA